MTSSIGEIRGGFTLERLAALPPASRAALLVIIAIVVTSSLARFVPWIATWPEAWTLPAAEWIGASVGAALEFVKPFARFCSFLLGIPMNAVNTALTSAPWPAIFGLLSALAWWIGGLRLASLAVPALLFVLLSGYWTESMSTLALVTVSVPLALAAGLAIGITAHEIPRLRRPIETVLDIMQTVPTFAYLTPLLVLFGFGPVVGLIASAIYAAPPMARNVSLGLERIESDIKEAASMAGTSRWQRLFLVEIPTAAPQILVGINQCVMAALSMVIIAAVIGGFDDIGWEVLLTMRKAQFGQSLLAGLVVVVFAILIDRLSGGLADSKRRRPWKEAAIIAGLGIALGAVSSLSGVLADSAALDSLSPLAEIVDQRLGAFTAEHGAALDDIKNGAMFYLLLPLRIGLDDAVLPFTWGFQWTWGMSAAFLGAGAAVAAFCFCNHRPMLASAVVVVTGTLHSGLTNLPWPAVVLVITIVSWRVGGPRLATLAAVTLGSILLAGLWDRAMLSLYLCGAAVALCAFVGGALGLLAALSPMMWRILRPVCDLLQTIPLFVFLIPMLMFFQIGEFSALLAICAYAVVPMIRYTRHGILSTPEELMESAISTGATRWQILQNVRIPYAAPTILLGLNQTILYAFAMLVIAALIGTTGLGQSIYIALGKADVGLGVAAGAAMALLALLADRFVQALAAERRAALGL